MNCICFEVGSFSPSHDTITTCTQVAEPESKTVILCQKNCLADVWLLHAIIKKHSAPSRPPFG